MNEELDEDIPGLLIEREAEDVTEKEAGRDDTPPSKRRRACVYNSEWEREDKFSWVTKCPDDRTKARCKICCLSFTVAYDGAKALVQHAETQKHQRNIQAAKASKQMSSFFCQERQFRECKSSSC